MSVFDEITNFENARGVDETRKSLDRHGAPFNGVYVLWNRHLMEPVYVGSAKHKASLIRHLAKDKATYEGVNHHLRVRGGDFLDYVLRQQPGWLGITFCATGAIEEMRILERTVIQHFRDAGYRLFNRR